LWRNQALAKAAMALPGPFALAPRPRFDMAVTLRQNSATSVQTIFVRVLILPAAVVAALVVILAAFAAEQGRSALIGGGIGLVASGYSVWRTFATSRPTTAQGELFTLYRAEFGKLVIIGALCALAFAAVDGLRVAGFLGGLVTAVLGGTIAAATLTFELPEEHRRQA
tara:strand:- start:331 stop:834 length:504 start_codon:yes stop_codon:yes gene_type:complete